MNGWDVTQLTFGTSEGRFHAHSYYDIPVFDAEGRRILAHRMSFSGRQPTPEDSVEVGIIDTRTPGSWIRLGESRAWSWQQGPMAQWVTATGQACWNDRTADGFVARLADPETGKITTLPRAVYALEPSGAFALSLDMARLELLRPGYGYAVTSQSSGMPRRPSDSGVWRVPLDGGAPVLILSLADAVRWMLRRFSLKQRLRHELRRYHYWFNHAKISPDGTRFTVKLRWRHPDKRWTSRQGVSLTCTTDGRDLRLLSDDTSHVIWQDNDRLYCWRKGELVVLGDTAPRGTRLGALAPDVIKANVHMRHLPPTAQRSPEKYVFDTPYSETIDLKILDAETEVATPIARFENHRPRNGPFRCDLHPCPDTSGQKIVVTSLHDGGRQLYLLSLT